MDFDVLWREARMVDLSHALHADMPAWPGHPRFGLAAVERVATGGVCCHNAIAMGEHSGTHLDAPLHFFERTGRDAASLPLAAMFGRMVTISVVAEGGTVSEPDILQRFEALHGPVRAGDAVFFHHGWDAFWHTDRDRFVASWPGLSRGLCEALVARGVRLVGTDCISVDVPGTEDFPAHHTLLGADIPIGENFNNLGSLPPICSLAALPLPIRGGSGAPVRAVAFLPARTD